MKRIEYKWIVAALAVFAVFMELLDMTVVTVAIPTLQTDFDVASASTIQWVVTGYLLSLAVFIPVSGWAGDRFGTKKLFMFALATFTSASLLCSLAWNIESLISFRILQGVGGGMLSPVAFSTLWRAFPPEERSKAAGIMVIPAAGAPASGPIVGGLLLKYASWHWIFLVNIPVGIAALMISALYLQEHKESRAGRFDALGFVLAAGGLGSILYALAEAGSRGFDDTRVVASLVAGAVLIVSFAAAELHNAEPMLDVRILKDGLFRVCNLSWITTMFGFSSIIFLLTLQLQAERGLSPLESGLTTFPMAVGVMLTAQPASRIYRVVGPRRMILSGLLGMGLITLLLAQVDLNTDLWVIRGLMLARGVAFGCTLVPLQAATYATISPAMTGRATALYNATSQVGSSLGVAVAAAILTSRLVSHGAQLGSPATRSAAVGSFQDDFLIMGVIALLASVIALFVNDRAAARTMNIRDAAVGSGELTEGEVPSAQPQLA